MAFKGNAGDLGQIYIWIAFLDLFKLYEKAFIDSILRNPDRGNFEFF